MKIINVPSNYLATVLVKNRLLNLSFPTACANALEICNLTKDPRISYSKVFQGFTHIVNVVEAEGEKLSSKGIEPHYHNRKHFSDAVTALSIYLRYSENIPNKSALLALIATVSHDLGHRGKMNSELPFTQESLTAEWVLSELKPYLVDEELALVNQYILKTDPNVVSNNHADYLANPDDKGYYLQVLINEADISASLIPELCHPLTDSLLRERGILKPSKSDIQKLFTAFKSQVLISTDVAKYFLNSNLSISK